MASPDLESLVGEAPVLVPVICYAKHELRITPEPAPYGQPAPDQTRAAVPDASSSVAVGEEGRGFWRFTKPKRPWSPETELKQILKSPSQPHSSQKFPQEMH